MNWAHRYYDDASPNDLRALADAWKKKLGNKQLIVSVVSQHEGRLHVVVTRTDDVSISAVQVLKQAVAPFGGRGGGRDDFAQGGIPEEIIPNERRADNLKHEIEKSITSYEAR